MNRSSKSYVTTSLEILHQRPSKKLSQNFLIDQNIANKIVRSAKIDKKDYVIEIGPGLGALTEKIAERGAYLTAIEKDSRLATFLQKELLFYPYLHMITADAKTFDFKEYIPQFSQGKKITIIGNLPYHISTPLITSLLPLYPYIDSMIFMIQKEYRQRMVAKPNTENYSSLSCYCAFFSKVSFLFDVSSHSFYPAPQVDSSVIQLQLHKPLLENYTSFLHYLRKVFHTRRKQMKTIIKKDFSEKVVIEALKTICKPSDSRAEQLSLQEHLAFFSALYSS